MLCVYYRFSLPPLPPELLTFPEDELTFSKGSLCQYLSFVTGRGYVNRIIKTSNVEKLVKVFQQNCLVSIEGLKDVEKLLCATLYKMLATSKDFDCIFPTIKSCELDQPACSIYFNAFLKKHKDIT